MMKTEEIGSQEIKEEAVEVEENVCEPADDLEATQREPAETGEAQEPEPSESEEKAETATELYDSMEPPRVGDMLRGKVVGIDENSVLVDVGYKSEGVIHISELSFRYLKHPSEAVEMGQEIDVVVLSVNGREGGLRLSKKRAEEEMAWEALKRAVERDEPVQAEIVQEVRGGLVADVGVRAFIPASQVDKGYVDDLSAYVGQTLMFKVLELDRDKRRVILSRRRLIEAELQKRREETWNTIKEGEIRHGIVKGITEFGAFVDVGGVDGLLHVSELSWKRVNHPSEVVHEGQEIDVMVLRVDRERERISLGLRQTEADPWESAEEKFPVDAVVEGTVSRLAPFGAFVEMEGGIEGLVHVSEMSDSRVDKPEDAVRPGQIVNVRILKVRSRDRRISLTMRGVSQPGGFREEASPSLTAPQQEVAVTLGDVFGDLLRPEAPDEEG